MIILFIITGGMVLKCVFNAPDSSCQITNFQTFGALAAAGVLEMVFEFKGLITIFKKKDDDK